MVSIQWHFSFTTCWSFLHDMTSPTGRYVFKPRGMHYCCFQSSCPRRIMFIMVSFGKFCFQRSRHPLFFAVDFYIFKTHSAIFDQHQHIIGNYFTILSIHSSYFSVILSEALNQPIKTSKYFVRQFPTITAWSPSAIKWLASSKMWPMSLHLLQTISSAMLRGRIDSSLPAKVFNQTSVPPLILMYQD